MVKKQILIQNNKYMKLINSQDPMFKPSVVMLVYGEGGVGKTTFCSTAPVPVLADCENGAKYFGLRGIKMDVAQIEKWSDMKDFLELAKGTKYETVIIDPIGELMDKLKKFMVASGETKNVQRDGSLTMAGWGNMKKAFKDYLKVLRDSGKHIILVAHIEEKDDEGRLVKRPKIETKIADDIVNMVDVVAYMTVVQQEGETKRILIVDPGNDKYTAKDRTGQLGKIIEPDFSKIVNACQGTKSYTWSKQPQEVKKVEEKKGEKQLSDSKVETPAKDMGVEVAPVQPPKKLSNPHLQAAKEKMAKATA